MCKTNRSGLCQREQKPTPPFVDDVERRMMDHTTAETPASLSEAVTRVTRILDGAKPFRVYPDAVSGLAQEIAYEHDIRRLLTAIATMRPIVNAAIGVMDQLNTYNDPSHREVHHQHLALQAALSQYFQPRADSPSKDPHA